MTFKFQVSSPAKTTGTVRGRNPVKPIRDARAEKAFQLACAIFAATAEAVRLALPRRSGKDRVGTASSNAVIFFAAAELSAVAAELMSGDVNHVQTWARLKQVVRRLEDNAIAYVEFMIDHPDDPNDPEKGFAIYDAYDEAVRALEQFEKYCQGREPQL